MPAHHCGAKDCYRLYSKGKSNVRLGLALECGLELEGWGVELGSVVLGF